MQPAVDRAGVPSGYTIELSHPLHDTVNSRAMSHLKDAVVTFPEGVRLNPSAGIGLSGCSPAEIGLKTDSKVVCPQSSAIGSVKNGACGDIPPVEFEDRYLEISTNPK